MKKTLILIIFCLLLINNLSANDIVLPVFKNCDYIFIFHGLWIFKFAEDGSINAQYGTGPFDNGYVSEKSIDFEIFYTEAKNLVIREKGNCSTQAVFHKRGEISSKAIYLKENSYIQDILRKFDSNWQSSSIEKLKSKHPFFMKKITTHCT